MPQDPGTAAVTAAASPTRSELTAHLRTARIAGDVATPRENNRSHYRSLAEGDRHYWLGLELGDRWTEESAVLAVMAERCGVVPDPAYTAGPDTIDPELCVAALDRMAARLREAARQRARVLFATGHPAGMFTVHRALAQAMAAAGCTVLLSGDIRLPDGRQEVRMVDRVAMLHLGGHLLHTHEPEPMRVLLDRLRDRDGGLPDLVVADHGWAGHAGLRGIPTVGFADCNDPALFLAEAEGTLLVTVPLDDNVSPQLYEPLTAYLLSAAGLDG
ncbi:phosphatase [Streptomyces sp. NPDC092296]|uniref:phosphatase n=1 Tax=Streptomyces sp. NPDC092296 TaxID=3366012 RepID=UPI00382BF6C7